LRDTYKLLVCLTLCGCCMAAVTDIPTPLNYLIQQTSVEFTVPCHLRPLVVETCQHWLTDEGRALWRGPNKGQNRTNFKDYARACNGWQWVLVAGKTTTVARHNGLVFVRECNEIGRNDLARSMQDAVEKLK
jgi:hypothetical protein